MTVTAGELCAVSGLSLSTVLVAVSRGQPFSHITLLHMKRTVWAWSAFMSFFFSSRRRHTILVSDWSSDVCSSDLGGLEGITPGSSCIANAYSNNHDTIVAKETGSLKAVGLHVVDALGLIHALILRLRSEERRVGKECRSRWSPYH